MQTQKIIELLGYSSNEAKVYLATLGLGECHVSDIAQKVKLPRSTVQMILDRLHKSGLAHFYITNRYKYWVAESPEKLLKQLQQREELVREALPRLTQLQKKNYTLTPKPSIRVFNGQNEIKLIFDDIIETKHHISAIIPEDDFLELFSGTTIIKDFRAQRAKNFLKIRILAPDTPIGRAVARDPSLQLAHVRLLPEHIGIKTVIYIYGNKVAHIMMNKNNPTAVLIEDSGVSETEMVLFEELWEQAGKLNQG